MNKQEILSIFIKKTSLKESTWIYIKQGWKNSKIFISQNLDR